MEFSIIEILRLLKKRFSYILLSTLLGLGSFYGVSQYIISPTYTASVQFYVDSGDAGSSAGLNELTYAQKIAATYIHFMQTRVFYQKVLDSTKLNYTQEELKKITSIEAVNNTEIFTLSVVTDSPRDSYLLAKAMQDIAPALIQDIKTSAGIRVIDPVVFPSGPTGPNVLLNTLFGGALGFLVSLFLLFLLELFDTKVKSQKDMEENYDIPILGTIPSYSTHTRKEFKLKKWLFKLKGLPFLKKSFLKKFGTQKKKTEEENGKSHFIIGEAYRSLRANLRFTLRGTGCKKILVSSPLPEEGKSTTCINLGITLAQAGARVLILDCDLRRGRIHSFFDISSRPGMSDALSGLSEVKSLIRNTVYPGLQVIPLGIIPPNPTELLSGSQMEELVKALEKDYDYLILDTPPVNIVSDSLGLAKNVDGILLVVRENVTSHPNIVTAVRKYQLVGGNILGFVINGIFLDYDNKKNKTRYHYYGQEQSRDD